MVDDEIGMDVDHLYYSYSIQTRSHIPTNKNTAQTSYRAAQNVPHISVKKKRQTKYLQDGQESVLLVFGPSTTFDRQQPLFAKYIDHRTRTRDEGIPKP